jgi:hypothetical protein
MQRGTSRAAVVGCRLEQFVSCAANGAELTYIATKFTGLPMRGNGTGRTTLWAGIGYFILDNL